MTFKCIVVKISNGKIESIVEKTAHGFFVNAGIDMLNPDYIDLI